MVAKRDSAEITDLGSIIQTEKHLDLASEYLEADDLKKCKQQLPKTNPHIPEDPTLAEFASNAAASGSAAEFPQDTEPSSKRQKRRKEPLSLDWDRIEVTSVRGFCPQSQTGKVEICQELKLANRWRVTYPRTTPGNKTFSLVYHDKDSEKRSVLACLRWAWRVHVQEGGQPCPYDLTS